MADLVDELALVMYRKHQRETEGEAEDTELDASFQGFVREAWRQVAKEALDLIEARREEEVETIRDRVMAFHLEAKQPIRYEPAIPPDEEVRLRLRLVTEEWREFVEACGVAIPRSALAGVNYHLDAAIIRCDLVKVADALADIDYVVEGTRLHFGVLGEPVAREVHRANMAKFGPGSSVRWDGKVLKPADWRPPDIEGVLRSLGWSGP